ncbi:receptor-interacting serine/threonine-protein kinase 3 [Micropterus salmoides]|uniref:receptor-interacting serine/threonine-protein kinase 3 n=1 Tax=Micropterus salmoides TaxID=27706 RepID=UPI0018ED31E4|nr:receptor-interacting serine/threonine-protein kinase 3 [Micropterus salmoides]XP_038587448.1 receptor-interacting serine/threonine-protein kinase 3 [Micropterus salmoides]XP_038587449.1 receptor-interacting serine/threonine-protein kinase 3 [Micropterus salmoides]XP_038587450.1 receptor-interacting serine/threonine-protein kinase 3 [Micropterus salmoides]
MALSSCPAPALIADSCLEGWKVIGSGGFGQIYKARHRQWCCDVAIKLLHYDDGTSKSLLHEIDMMRQGSSPYVIQVLGVFKGRLPSSVTSTQLGLVMEVMERGSLASLQDTLDVAIPWPLVVRLAHQVALGINFLHSMSPALLHLDLKPSNVLLDSYLNAKLTDFGLARFYHSVTRASKKDSEGEGGTISYMPPEAFNLSYTPTRASDVYSYGILLWSIVTGKQPYANAMSSIVRFRIPQGDRPSLDEIRGQCAGRTGLIGLMELMEKCWEDKPDQRPSSLECTTVTEELYKMHKHAIVDAVHQVLKRLDQKEEERIREQVETINFNQASVNTKVGVTDVCDNVPTGRPPVQEMADGWTENQRDKSRVKDSPSPQPASMSYVGSRRSPTDHEVKVSSVHPIQSSQSSRLPAERTTKPSQPDLKKILFPPYQRQFSSPETSTCHLPPAAGGVNIHLSNVVGFQHGNNNNMHLYTTDPLDRKRHPTAPPSVNLLLPHSGSSKDKKGGVG